MPDWTIMGLVSNKEMSEEKLQKLVESLTEIRVQGREETGSDA